MIFFINFKPDLFLQGIKMILESKKSSDWSIFCNKSSFMEAIQLRIWILLYVLKQLYFEFYIHKEKRVRRWKIFANKNIIRN